MYWEIRKQARHWYVKFYGNDEISARYTIDKEQIFRECVWKIQFEWEKKYPSFHS